MIVIEGVAIPGDKEGRGSRMGGRWLRGRGEGRRCYLLWTRAARVGHSRRSGRGRVAGKGEVNSAGAEERMRLGNEGGGVAGDVAGAALVGGAGVLFLV